MRRACTDKFESKDIIYLCSCGRRINGTSDCRMEKSIGTEKKIIKDGCDRCFEKWMKNRVNKAITVVACDVDESKYR